MKVNAARFGERCSLPDGHVGECELADTLSADRVTEAAPASGHFTPHEFVGRLDRRCEACNKFDRDSIHARPTYVPRTSPADLPVAAPARPGPASVAPAEPPEYDYERLIDLAARIGNCAHKIDLSKRTAEGNKAAIALAAQIGVDIAELQAILRARQAAIEGAPGA